MKPVCGKEYGRLLYLGEDKVVKNRIYGKYRCKCGSIVYKRNDGVLCGSVKSCGCLVSERKNPFGLESSDYEKLFGVWRNMMKRCYDKESERYYTYGERGIVVCDEWKNDFKVFAEWALKNGWRVGLSIERQNINGNYCPENCTFITMKEQARNKTSNIRIVYGGKERCIAEWCEILGLYDKTIYARYARGTREPTRLFYPGDLRELKGCG